MKMITVIGSASCQGAKDQRGSAGPYALKNSAAISNLRTDHQLIQWLDVYPPPPGTNPSTHHAIAQVCSEIAHLAGATLTKNRLPVVVGGDHSCAIGTWSGIHHAIQKSGPLGLIWFDAHMDSHTPETTKSGAVNGMPLACLLGYGDPLFTNIKGSMPKLLPEHVTLIGVRSYESEEKRLLNDLGVRIYFMEELEARGLEAVVEEALEIVTNGAAGYGISIDLDVLDPGDAPGVFCPVPGGIRYEALNNALAILCRKRPPIAVEFAELNPARDEHNKTADHVAGLFQTLLSQIPKHIAQVSAS